LPKRVAVISVESSKGFADFQEIIDAQANRFAIFRMLFPALLQGDKAVESILKAMKRVRCVSHHFDAVAIIRGGGGDVGLSCFNHYELARAIADFPIPVYTGIGHSTNETVCEMVSHYNGITPTKVAQQLLDYFERFDRTIAESQRSIIHRSQEILLTENRELNLHSRIIQQAVGGMLQNQHQRLIHVTEEVTKSTTRLIFGHASLLNAFMQRIPVATVHGLRSSTERVDQLQRQLLLASKYSLENASKNVIHLERIVTITDPQNILRKGYSITYRNGIPVNDSAVLNAGDRITTLLANGSFESEITTISNT
jgi:exodeoxyribonuclease VII large subunit